MDRPAPDDQGGSDDTLPGEAVIPSLADRLEAFLVAGSNSLQKRFRPLRLQSGGEARFLPRAPLRTRPHLPAAPISRRTPFGFLEPGPPPPHPILDRPEPGAYNIFISSV